MRNLIKLCPKNDTVNSLRHNCMYLVHAYEFSVKINVLRLSCKFIHSLTGYTGCGKSPWTQEKKITLTPGNRFKPKVQN